MWEHNVQLTFSQREEDIQDTHICALIRIVNKEQSRCETQQP